ncbi:unnamed protein product [Lampetra fluviatilis]
MEGVLRGEHCPERLELNLGHGIRIVCVADGTRHRGQTSPHVNTGSANAKTSSRRTSFTGGSWEGQGGGIDDRHLLTQLLGDSDGDVTSG